MNRIQRVSKVVKLLAYALAGCALLFALMSVWLLFKMEEEAEPARLMMIASTLLTIVLAAMFYHIARLAEQYEKGRLFTNANVRHLRTVGLLTFLTIVTVGLDYDQSTATFVNEFEFNVGPIISGFLLVFLSWVTDEARKLDEDHRLTI